MGRLGAVSSIGERRHTPSRPCPICGGHVAMARGRHVRCAGFTLDVIAVCTREELAGRLALDVGLVPPGYRHRLSGDCGCGKVHARGPARVTSPLVTTDRAPALPVEQRHEIYSFAFSQIPLRREALENLRRRGLAPKEVEADGFVSVPLGQKERSNLVEAVRSRFGADALRLCPGFHDKNGRLVLSPAMVNCDGYFVPYRDELRRLIGFQVKVLGAKYLSPLGTRYTQMYSVVGPPGETLFLTEGGLKAIVASAVGRLWCLGVPGQSLQPAHIEAVRRLAPMRVAVALDRESNPDTDSMRLAWLKALAAAGFATYDAVWEQE